MSQELDVPASEALEAAAGVAFADREVLQVALTHRSYLNEATSSAVADNERLEFLGDALMDYVAGDYLYRLLPEAREGELTSLRSALVCEAATARYARELDLGTYLRLGRGEAVSGGRNRPALLGDAFEALVGAILIDQGMVVAERFVRRFIEPELTAVLAGRRTGDSRSRFQEIAQERWQQTPQYETVSEHGPDHAKSFQVRVSVAGKVWGVGEGPSKAVAARRAAMAALGRLESPDIEAGGAGPAEREGQDHEAPPSELGPDAP